MSVLDAYSVRLGHWMLQGHMLCSCERQSVCAVVADQLRDAGEDTAALVQCVAQAFATFSLGYNDVDTTLTGPVKEKEKETHTDFRKCCKHRGRASET